MNENFQLPSATHISSKLTRRQILQRMLEGTLTGLALPLLPDLHPIRKHLSSSATLSKADAQREGATWKPLVLSAQQDESLVALSESIVSRSAKAQVNRFIDLLLSVDTPENQQKFVSALAAMEKQSQKRFAGRFSSLSEDQKNSLLTMVSMSPWSLLDEFKNLKGWIVGAYYSSEAGMTELGWTPDRVFERFPACPHLLEHY